MNERINKLIEQAGQDNLEKFAELILEDVMSICEDLGDKGMDGHYCVDAIRKRFKLAHFSNYVEEKTYEIRYQQHSQ